MPNLSLVSTEWLASNLSKVKILDASWHMPNPNKNAKQDFVNAHIAGANFFDIEKISDVNSKLPHMLPSLAVFEQSVGDLGISEDDHVVVYDCSAVYSSFRGWWTFKVFGHKNVSVLDGGFSKWQRENRPVTNSITPIVKQTYTAKFDSNLVKSYAQICANLDSKTFQVVDARPKDRFSGAKPEPRPGVSSGHMPGSFSIPFGMLMNPETNTLKPKNELIKVFENAGVKLDLPVVTSCGSGVTAAVLYFALKEVLEVGEVGLYDGSWSEYGGEASSRILKSV